MLYNHLKIAWRNLIRNKMLTLINVGGLSIGIATCFLILQYVQFERSYDQFLDNKERMYRIDWHLYQGGDLTLALPKAAAGAGPKLLADFPEVVAQTRMYKIFGTVNISHGGRAFNESKVLFASEDFFKVLSFPLIYGEKEDVLNEPNKVVLSKSAAARYFPGMSNPTGKILRLKEGDDWDMSLMVSGVMEDLPANSHMEADVLVSHQTYINSNPAAADSFWWVNFYTYILTAPGTTKELLDSKLAAWIPTIDNYRDEEEGDRPKVYAQPITDIHLFSNLAQEMKANGDARVVSILLAAAFIILVIAWLNYINLTTAKGLERAKEVGIKKVIGASRGQLVGQFLLEATLINGISLLIAFTLYQFGQPLVHSLLPAQPHWQTLFNGSLFWVIGAVLFAGAFVSGYYPALVISSYKPIAILKGRVSHSPKGHALRKIMVSLQFILSLGLLVSTFTVKDQVSYMLNQDLGMNLEQVVVALAPDAYVPDHKEKVDLFRHELLSSPGINEVSQSRVLPGEAHFYNWGMQVGSYKGNSNNYGQGSVDPHFIPLLGIELVAGRNFDPNLVTDKSAVVVNESALSVLEFVSPEDALGKQIWWMDEDFGAWTIIGVVKDHHQYALSRKVEPMIYYQEDQPASYFTFKLQSGNIHESVAHLAKTYETFFPGNPFDYYFLDEHFNRQYQADRQMISAFGGFAVVAIIIACLGLFGLASFEAVQRTKEVGIRKVLGASVSSIALLFSGKFFRLLLLSAVICLPLCYQLMDRWLDNYPYRMDLGWQVFVLPVVLLFTVALITLIYHILKTVRLNPVDALRNE